MRADRGILGFRKTPPPRAQRLHLPARHRPTVDEVDRRIARLNAHLHHHQSINPVVVARTLEWLLRQEAIESQIDLDLRLGVDESWVSRTLRILDLPKDLLDKVVTSQLLISTQAVGEIASLQDRRWQEELIAALLGGASEHDIRARIKRLNGKASSGGGRFKADYKTCHQSAVVIRSRFKRLTPAQEREVLLDALAQLTKRSELEETRALA